MTRVWIAQCLCPQRHCIMAAAGEAADADAADQTVGTELREQVAALLQSGAVNPWCGLCRSPVESWHYELGRTPFRSLAEAMPALRQEEEKQRLTAAVLGDDLKRSD